MRGKVYKFYHDQDYTFLTNHCVGYFSNDWLKLDGYSITVRGSNMTGYAWDGCSPKTHILDLVIGTPDGMTSKETRKPITYYASMVHDCLYQFKKEVPISRKTTDLIFLEMLQEENFFFARLYYIMVRTFGWLYGTWCYKKCYNK